MGIMAILIKGWNLEISLNAKSQSKLRNLLFIPLFSYRVDVVCYHGHKYKR